MARLDAYNRLPIALQQVAFSMKSHAVHRRRYGGRFGELLDEALRRESWSQDELAAYQVERLRVVLAQANPASAGGSSTDDPFSLLAGYPVDTKHDARSRARAIDRSPGQVWVATGGTSGAPLRFPTTRIALQQQWAMWWRYRMWHGLSLGVWSAHFGGQPIVPASVTRPPFWRINRPSRQVYFSPLHLTAETAPVYTSEMRRRRLSWIHGYPSVIAMLASYILDSSLDPGVIEWVTVGAENLTHGQAEVITAAFGVRPRQHYGLAEGVANFSECVLGTLHVDEDFSIVEFVPTDESGQFRVVGTALINPRFPFIRYDTGDLVSVGAGCDCGRRGRAVRSVDGRASDFLKLPDGSLFGPANQVFKGIPNVREARLLFDDGAIVAEIVPTTEAALGAHTQLEDRVAESLRHRNSNYDVAVRVVTALPRTAAGKIRAIG